MPKEFERVQSVPSVAESAPEMVESEATQVEAAPRAALESASVPPAAPEQGVSASIPPSPTASPVVPAIKDELTKRVERVLEEDLTDIFLSMKPQDQRAFVQAGEQTASKIRNLMSAAAKNAQKILELIRLWLTRIPGVNRFFLEQEAKIKTDKILHLNP